MLLEKQLQQHFGHDFFRDGQKEIIEQILEKKSSLAIFPTGAGKSICYQLPALVFEGLTVIVSPLLSLIEDQVNSLQRRNIPVCRLDSTLDSDATQATLEKLAQHQAKILFLSPERLAHKPTFDFLKKLSLSFVAIDEAHCFSRWGQSFRPDYRRLPGLIRKLKPDTVLALTATASSLVARDIRTAFKIPARNETRLPLSRPNLSWHISPTLPKDKIERLTDRLKSEGAVPAVVYCTRQLTTVEVAAALSQAGLSARAFHAGIPSDSRSEILNGFLDGSFSVIVATIAFGMGVDKADVRSVFHYEVPRSPEAWMQESGRAGRDGAPAHTEIFPTENDFVQHRTLTLANQPTKTAIERIISQIFTGARDVLISPYKTTTDSDLSRQALDTILIYLEIDGLITRRAILHRKLRISLLQTLAKITAEFTPAEKKRITQHLTTRGWIDLFNTTTAVSEISKIIDVINTLEEAGDIRVTRSHQLHLYRVSAKKLPSPKALIERFVQHFHENASAEIERLDHVQAILTSRRCVSRSLLGHLGEKNSPPCGNCSRCLKQPLKKTLPYEAPKQIDTESLEQIQALARENISALASPAQLTRHLLGINSPAAQITRLYRRDTYGLLKQQSWEDVFALSKSLIG